MTMTGRLTRVTVALAVTVSLLIGLAGAASATIAPGDATVRVHVTYADGSPAPFAQVDLCRGALPDGFVDYFCATAFTPDHTGDQIAADASGVAEFSGVAGGTFQVKVSRENLQDYEGTAADDWSLPNWQIGIPVPAGTTTEITLALREGSKVTGTVTDDLGQPVDGAHVRACPNPTVNGYSCADTTADQSGVYTTPVVLGPEVIVYSLGKPGVAFPGTSASLHAPGGEVTSVPTLVTDPGTMVSGTVRDEIGNGVASAIISSSDVTSRCFVASIPCQASTDASGGYSLWLPSVLQTLQSAGPAGGVYISAAPVQVDLSDRAPRTVDFVLARGARIESQATATGGTMPTFSGAVACTAPGVPVWVGGTTCQQPDGSTLPTVGRYDSGPGPYRNIVDFPVPGSYNVRWIALSNTLTVLGQTPTALVHIAPGDVVQCTFEIDLTGATEGSSSCSGATGGPVDPSNSVTIPAAVGGGDVEITTPVGTQITAATSIDPATIASPLPVGVDLPSGAFGFTVAVPDPGTGDPATVDITIDYPATATTPNGYVKLIDGEWVDASYLVVAQTPTSTTIRLTDGGPGDDDGAVNGVIVDPGAPAFFDREPPSISITGVTDGASYTFGAVPVASCTAVDTYSPIDGACTVTVTGGTTLGVGSFTVTGTATDAAGNVGTAAVSYRVVYATDGFTGQVDNQPVVNTGKAGRAYPVTFALRRADGSTVTDLAAVTSIRLRSISCISLVGQTADDLGAEATGGSSLRITGDQFHFNWATPTTSGCYQLMVSLADGSALRADFSLR